MMDKKSYGDPQLHIDGDKACDWCENPSTHDNRVKAYPYDLTKLNGIYLYRHPQCQEEAKKNTEFNPVENYIAASIKRAVYPTLVCDNPHCDSDYDVGDDNETDARQVVGEPCWECGRGQLEYKTANSIYNYTNPWENPAHGQGALERLPKSPEPSAPMEQYGDNMDPNNDATPPQNPIPVPPGTGSIPGKRATATYEDLRKHLIHGHGYKEHWIMGYNPKLLLGLHIDSHKE